MELVFGEDLGKSVGLLDSLCYRRRRLLLFVTETTGIEDIRAHPQFLGGFLSDGQRIARHHLHFHAHLLRGRDGCLGVVARWIEQRQNAEKLPWAVSFRKRHPQRTKAARREFVYRLIDDGLHLWAIGRQRQNHLRRALRHLEGLSAGARHGGLGAFAHRIERLKMAYLVVFQRLIIF